MSGRLIEDRSLRNRTWVFEDRVDAGRRLSSLLASELKGTEVLLAIPSGGVPVAAEIARAHSLHLDLLIVRKTQIPWNPEAGFGAVDPEGTVVLNEDLLRRVGLKDNEIRREVERTSAVISRRNTLFRQGRPAPDIRGKDIILVDDGLAAGYTMLAALRYVRKRDPGRIIVAVPTALDRTIDLLLGETDLLACLNVRAGPTFAVAAAYRVWHDIGDGEVLSLLTPWAH